MKDSPLHLVVMSPWAPLTVTISQTVFLMTLTVLRSVGHLYSRMLLCWNFCDVFLMSRLVYGLGEKDDRGKCHFHHIISRG